MNNARYEAGWYYCWLIERRNVPQPEWWGVNGYVTNAREALWFARRSDADTFAGEMAADVVVCEHGFTLDSQPASTGEIGEIVAELTKLHADMRANGMLLAMPIVKRAIAYLSHSGEQQQLVEALPTSHEITVAAQAACDTRQPSDPYLFRTGFRDGANWLYDRALSANKASDVPTAGYAALREAAKDQWQPIETAPKDRTSVILGWQVPGLVRYGYYLDNSKTEVSWSGWRAPSMELPLPVRPPTHWMPLPDPPVLERFAGEGE